MLAKGGLHLRQQTVIRLHFALASAIPLYTLAIKLGAADQIGGFVAIPYKILLPHRPQTRQPNH